MCREAKRALRQEFPHQGVGDPVRGDILIVHDPRHERNAVQVPDSDRRQKILAKVRHAEGSLDGVAPKRRQDILKHFRPCDTGLIQADARVTEVVIPSVMVERADREDIARSAEDPAHERARPVFVRDFVPRDHDVCLVERRGSRRRGDGRRTPSARQQLFKARVARLSRGKRPPDPVGHPVGGERARHRGRSSPHSGLDLRPAHVAHRIAEAIGVIRRYETDIERFHEAAGGTVAPAEEDDRRISCRDEVGYPRRQAQPRELRAVDCIVRAPCRDDRIRILAQLVDQLLFGHITPEDDAIALQFSLVE
jgi:hypothetical protein